MGDTPVWKKRIEHLDPSTQATYARICRRYGVSDDTTWADIRSEVERVRNPNTKRSVIGALITCLGTKEGAPKQPRPQPKVYDLPSHAQIRDLAHQGYGAFIYAMAYAGLRVGEAVALTPGDLGKAGERYWINVRASKQYTGRIKEPKTGPGRVLIPEWLYDYLRTAEYPEILPNSLYKWMRRRGVTPHALRHFYATYLVRNVQNPELARRQLRHANLTTTLAFYAQVTAEDEAEAVALIPDPLRAA